jgi:hypothetical protein
MTVRPGYCGEMRLRISSHEYPRADRRRSAAVPARPPSYSRYIQDQANADRVWRCSTSSGSKSVCRQASSAGWGVACKVRSGLGRNSTNAWGIGVEVMARTRADPQAAAVGGNQSQTVPAHRSDTGLSELNQTRTGHRRDGLMSAARETNFSGAIWYSAFRLI